MGIGYAVGNVILAPLHYENWAEVIASTTKRQEPARVILKNGLKIETGTSVRFLVREIFLRKIYTPANLAIGDNDIVVDIGANNGVFTMLAASITRNTVHAFEPAPNNYEFLQRNIRANGLSNVIAHNAAVSDTVGSAKLFLNADGLQNLLTDHILPDKIEGYMTRTDLNYLIPGPDKVETSIEVPTTTLQEIMDSNNIERLGFLKLDCEGAEGTILHAHGMRNELSSSKEERKSHPLKQRPGKRREKGTK